MKMTKLFSNPHKTKQGISNVLRRQFYRFLLNKYANGYKTVLDVGCGNNIEFIQTAKKMGYNAKGLEIDERFKSADVEIGDIFKATGKCNVAFSNHVIERFTSEEQEKFIKKLSELSDDLIVIIGSYNSISFYNTPDFRTPVTKVRLRWLLRRYGFRNLLAVHIPFWKAAVVVSKKVKDEMDKEAVKIKEGFW